MEEYTGKIPYKREYAGSLEIRFYSDMKHGLYGKEGEKFVKTIENFQGKPGGFFWSQLWRMLICCNFLKNNYQSSFSFYLKKKYVDYKGLTKISDDDFKNISSYDWEEFKRKVNPWNELYGIGENVFDFIMGDVIGFKFVENSYKLDLANIHFLKVTGIFKEESLERQNVIDYLIDFDLHYTLREINKGLYAYCSITEKNNCGFCRSLDKCRICKVNEICEKNF